MTCTTNWVNFVNRWLFVLFLHPGNWRWWVVAMVCEAIVGKHVVPILVNSTYPTTSPKPIIHPRPSPLSHRTLELLYLYAAVVSMASPIIILLIVQKPPIEHNLHNNSTFYVSLWNTFNGLFPSKICLQTLPTSSLAHEDLLGIPPYSCGWRDDVIMHFDKRSSHPLH